MALEGLVDEAKFFPQMQTLATCLCEELAKAGGPPLCYCGLWAGDAEPLFGMMDRSIQDGVAWVRPAQAYGSLNFPNPAEFTPCDAPLAMQIEIGVARCFPRAVGRQIRPEAQAMFDATRLYMSDLAAMRRAVKCCFQNQRNVMLGTWSPIPVGMGISGGTWTVFVG